MSIFPSLKEFRDIVKSHVGSDFTEKSEPLLSKVLGRFDSILSNLGDDDNTIEAAKRKKSTDWGLLLKDTVDFLQNHKGLIQDVQSQALRIDEDIRLLLDIAHTKVAKGGIDDEYLMERFIQLATSLPDGSETQVKLTGTLIKGLWDSLQHPPLSYLGDGYEYRTADGSNNVILSRQNFAAYGPLTNQTLPLERLKSKARNGRHAIRKKCHPTDPWEAVPRPGRGVRQTASSSGSAQRTTEQGLEHALLLGYHYHPRFVPYR
jgi:hypothetical protein